MAINSSTVGIRQVCGERLACHPIRLSAEGSPKWVSIPSLWTSSTACRTTSPWLQCFQAMQGQPVTPLVRVPWNEPGIIGKVLDGGAMGIVCRW